MQRHDRPENLNLALDALQTAVKTDPSFALGYAELGEAYRLKFSHDQNPKWTDEALANCRKALELDDRLPIVYVTLGRIHDSGGKYDLALQEFQRSLQLDPRNADSLIGLAGSYENAGRVADAEAPSRKQSRFVLTTGTGTMASAFSTTATIATMKPSPSSATRSI